LKDLDQDGIFVTHIILVQIYGTAMPSKLTLIIRQP